MFTSQLGSDPGSDRAFAACHQLGLPVSVGSQCWARCGFRGAQQLHPSHPTSNPRTPSEEEILGPRVASLGGETETPHSTLLGIPWLLVRAPASPLLTGPKQDPSQELRGVSTNPGPGPAQAPPRYILEVLEKVHFHRGSRILTRFQGVRVQKAHGP